MSTPANASVVVTPMPAAPAGAPAAPAVAPEAPVQTPEVIAPVVPVEAAPAPTELTVDAPQVVDATNNKVFDDIASLLKDKNVTGINDIFKAIADNGEVSLADHAKIMEALGESLGNVVINQLTGEVAGIKDAKQAKSQVTLDYAVTKFGDDPAQGAEVWKAIQDFTRTPESGFTSEDRTAMTKMLQAGGLQAELVIDRIHSRWENSSGTTQAADLIQGSTVANATFTPVSKQDYSTQMRELVNTHGYDSHQAEALRQKRATSVARGY